MTFLIPHNIIPKTVFGYSSVTVDLILLLIGIGLCFWGEKSWKLIMLALGAYGGFVLTAYLIVKVHLTGLPTLLLLAIGAVIGAVLVRFLSELAICGAIAFAVFIGLYYVSGASVLVAGIAAVIVFAITYLRFKKVIIYVAAFAGALAVWISLYSIGLPDISAELIAALAMIIGIVLQKYEGGKTPDRRFRNEY